MVEDVKEETANPSYVGAWIGNDMFIEVGIIDGKTEVKICDKNKHILTTLGDFELFAKRIKDIRKVARKVGNL